MTDTNQNEAIRYFDLRMRDIHESFTDASKQESLFDDCLAIHATITLNIQLSTGGPGDGFEIVCDVATGEPVYGLHYFLQWGYRRECPLSQSELSDVCAAYAIEDARTFLIRRR